MVEIDPNTAEVVSKSPYVMGFLGALIVSIKGMPGASLWERLVNVACGAILAGVASPAASEYFSLHTAAMQSAMAFAVGMFGLNIVAAFQTWLKTMKVDDYIPWKKRDE